MGFDNKQQPVHTVEAGGQKRRAEKVSRPTLKMGSSEDDFIFFKCLFELYKRCSATADEKIIINSCICHSDSVLSESDPPATYENSGIQ